MSLPLRLPGIARAEVEARRVRAAPRAPLPLAGGELGFDPDPAASFRADVLNADLRWGAAHLQVACPPDLVTWLLGRLGGNRATSMPAPDLLGLLVEAALLPEVSVWEAHTGQALRCLRIASSAETGQGRALSLIFSAGERRWPVRLRGDDAALLDILRAWPVRPSAWASLPIALRSRLGATRLSLRIVRSLGVADVVLIETPTGGSGLIVIGETKVARAEGLGTSWRLDESPRHPTQGEKELIMGRVDEATTMDEGPGSLDDIPVRLVFDLGQAEMPLGEVRRLGAGAIVETGQRTDDFVRINANGRLVGHGRLVDLDGRLGVEIVRLFDHG